MLLKLLLKRDLPDWKGVGYDYLLRCEGWTIPKEERWKFRLAIGKVGRRFPRASNVKSEASQSATCNRTMCNKKKGGDRGAVSGCWHRVM